MLAVVAALATQPTAPFREDAVRAEIEAQLRQCPHVQFERDAFGNVIARYRRGRRRAKWAFAAHMDHPGWVRGRNNEMEFLGSVPERFRQNPKTKSFGDFAMWELSPFEIRDATNSFARLRRFARLRGNHLPLSRVGGDGRRGALRGFVHAGGRSRFCRRDQTRAGGYPAAQPDDSFARNEHTARLSGNREGSDRSGGGQGFQFRWTFHGAPA